MNAPAEACAIPRDEAGEVEHLLAERHSDRLSGEETLHLEGSEGTEGVALHLRVTDPAEERVIDLEVAVPSDAPWTRDMTGPTVRSFAYDVLDALLGEVLEEGPLAHLPADWSEGTYEGKSVRFRGSLRNLRLEREADALLRERH